MTNRYNVFVSDETDFRLREVAFKTKRKVPDILRDAITHYLASQNNPGNGPVAVLGSVAPDVAAIMNDLASAIYTRIEEISIHQQKMPPSKS